MDSTFHQRGPILLGERTSLMWLFASLCGIARYFPAQIGAHSIYHGTSHTGRTYSKCGDLKRAPLIHSLIEMLC